MEFRNCVENRRSIRSFRPDPVRREDILYCLDAARLSPSSLNCQPWRFVVLDDPQLKNRAAKLYQQSPAQEQSPCPAGSGTDRCGQRPV